MSRPVQGCNHLLHQSGSPGTHRQCTMLNAQIMHIQARTGHARPSVWLLCCMYVRTCQRYELTCMLVDMHECYLFVCMAYMFVQQHQQSARMQTVRACLLRLIITIIADCQCVHQARYKTTPHNKQTGHQHACINTRTTHCHCTAVLTAHCAAPNEYQMLQTHNHRGRALNMLQMLSGNMRVQATTIQPHNN